MIKDQAIARSVASTYYISYYVASYNMQRRYYVKRQLKHKLIKIKDGSQQQSVSGEDGNEDVE